MKSKPFFIVASFLPFIFVFLATLHHPSDPDLGWHLKYGEYFFQHFDILRENTFSTMMSDYRWPNTSWGVDILTYGIFKLGRFLGLSIAAGLIVAATFFFFSRAAKLSLWDQAFTFPILVFFLNPVNSVSFRGQQFSLLLTGALFFILSQVQEKKWIRFLIPILFLFWVNIHGQFILGLGLFFLWIVVRVITSFFSEEARGRVLLSEIKLWVPIFIASIAATLITPFGIGLLKVSISHFNNPNLRFIAEYTALNDQSQLFRNMVLLLVLMVIGLMSYFFSKTWKRFLPETILAIVLFVLTMFVRRYAWTMYYTALPILVPVFGIYKPVSKKWSTIIPSILLLVLIAFVVLDKQNKNLTNMSWSSYCNFNDTLCSGESADFLEKNKSALSLDKNPEKLISLYGWGGYMIWNYPSIKPSIDGRMHLWQDGKGYSAFEEYYALEQAWEDIDKSRFDVVYMSPQKPLYDALVELVRAGKWRQIYKDRRAGIFVRSKLSQATTN